MLENALYYPYINFRTISWLKAMALFYNRIYRIVPASEKPNDIEEIKPLLDSGEIGTGIDPIKYSQEASNTFLEKISTNWNAAALSFSGDDKQHLTQLHSDKTDEKVKALFKEIGYKEAEKWFYVPTEIASNYMLYLATVVARKNNLTLLADEFAPWTATNYFNLDGAFDDWNIPPQGNDTPYNMEYLFSLVIHELTPLNIADIPIKDIIKFREKRRNEIANLRNSINNLCVELQNIDDRAMKADKITDTLKNYEKSLRDYKASADIIKAAGWFGISVMGLPALGILAEKFNISDMRHSILLCGGLALGAVYSLTSMKSSLKKLKENNPLSCLFLMEKDFKRFTTKRGGGDINFRAYNCMEEYIND